MFNVQVECSGEGVDVIVRNVPLLTYGLNDRCNSRIVILRHGGKQMMNGLIVESTAEEGAEKGAMSIIETGLDLRYGPFVINGTFDVQPFQRSRDMRDLEIEGQIPTSDELGNEEID